MPAAVPAGLTAVPQLYDPTAVVNGGYELDDGYAYAETHTLTRFSSDTVTVDQAGGGSAGTFTVDVVGSSAASDVAAGSGGNTMPLNTVVPTGTVSSQSAYHPGLYPVSSYAVMSRMASSG